MELLEQVKMEISNFSGDLTDFFTPQEMDDEVIGEASDFAKRCYTLAQRYSQQADRIAIDFKYTAEMNQRDELNELILKCGRWKTIYLLLFDLEVRQQAGIYSNALITRKGFKLCRLKKDGGTLYKLLGLE